MRDWWMIAGEASARGYIPRLKIQMSCQYDNVSIIDL